jgi:error-prone DNA polymerase
MYAELHARSAFSFLEGSSLPEDLVAACEEQGISTMALLDRDNVAGAVRFHEAAKKIGVRAHVGAEVTGADGSRYPLIAESREGYQNLCRLLTNIKLRAEKGKAAATLDDLAQHAKGLVCLTGDENGPLAKGLGARTGRKRLEDLAAIFGRQSLYVELQRHFTREAEVRNQAALELARSMGLKLLATNGVSYADKGSRELLDALTCVRHKVKIREAGRLLSRNDERHVKRPVEMERLFEDLPEAIANTRELSTRLDFTLEDLGYEFPKYPVPPGETMDSFLRARTDEGARNRYRPYTDQARQQIERELALIEKLRLAGYFLIVWDMVRFCREGNILAQGRGSAANSAVCYALGITAVDPVSMELLFERFLSEERGEWPDIDIDLPSGDQRERVIQYVYQRYGERGAAMTANVITYRGRSAARDLGKALGFNEEELGRLSKLVPTWGWKDPEREAARDFELAGFSTGHPRVAKFLDLYLQVQDLPRHLGQHSGGMIICQGALDTIVPLEPATMPGRVVVQWDKDDCASAGIIKVDLLGLGMLAVIEETIELARTYHGEEIDLAHLPQDDATVYEALKKADTIGMFQIESRAQMSCLPRMQPKRFYDIVVQVAIIRPGPIVGQMLNPFIRRRQGREEVDYLHPDLEPVLKRTLGVPLFQEQILRMAMIIAGFSGGEAEELRRAFSFKRSEKRMREVEVKLRRGMSLRNIRSDVQERVIKSITSFALYGFPESHAASFALIAYASAYLKCHYLAVFTAAMLNNQPMGFYSPATLIKDAQRHGLHFKPVDVTRSEWLSTIEEHDGEKQVRLGLNYIKGLHKQACEDLLNERKRAPFKSIRDLARRVPALRRDALKMLARAGALNFLNPESCINRRDALWAAEIARRRAGPLLDLIPEEDMQSPLRPMNRTELLRADFRGTGLTIGKHPMAFHRAMLDELGVTPANDLMNLRNGQFVVIAGCVICRQRPGTAKGLVFLSMEDETGVSNAVVMPDVFERYETTIINHGYLLIRGVLQSIDGVITVKTGMVEALEDAVVKVPSHDFH